MIPGKSGYMLTIEQKEKAKKKLRHLGYNSLPMYDEDINKRLEQKFAFNCHIWACRMVDEYNLPYRVILNYLKNNGYDYLKCAIPAHKDDVILINRLYPKPGYDKSVLPIIKWSNERYEINPCIRIEYGPFADDLTSSKWDIRTFIDDEEIAAKMDVAAKQQYTWDLTTKDGIKSWEHEFAHFLADEDFSKYTTVDWFGIKKPMPDESKIDYWKKLQSDFRKHPDEYRQEEPKYYPEYDDKYTLLTFVIDFENKAAANEFKSP